MRADRSASASVAAVCGLRSNVNFGKDHFPEERDVEL